MKLPVVLIFSSFLFISSVTIAQPVPTAEEEAFFTKLMSGINSKHVQWVKNTARETNEKKLSPEDIKAKTQAYAVLGSMNGQDIEALAFLVMMQAAKSAQEDLKAIMAKVKAINVQKAKQRELLSKMQQQRTMTAIQLDSFKLLQNRTLALQQGRNADSIKFVRSSGRNQQVSKADIDAMKDKLKSDLDSMSEMGEMESLRLQMAMDRMSKMMSTLSNLLKKISKTADDIIQNLK
ncbi:MAG TPA: hypothetical protein PK977_18845, partial [Chitinophagaceae bacterium]|nr:hypothetical protein [Chitinophagaceae bacterium]